MDYSADNAETNLIKGLLKKSTNKTDFGFQRGISEEGNDRWSGTEAKAITNINWQQDELLAIWLL